VHTLKKRTTDSKETEEKKEGKREAELDGQQQKETSSAEISSHPQKKTRVWQENPKNNGRKSKQHRERGERGTHKWNPSECWFCLSNPKIETHLIVNVGESSYLALPKGGVNDDHVLIISINHATHWNHLSADDWREFRKYQSNLSTLFAKDNKMLVSFFFSAPSKNPQAQHVHMQVTPPSS
jgi:hypothetical protein